MFRLKLWPVFVVLTCSFVMLQHSKVYSRPRISPESVRAWFETGGSIINVGGDSYQLYSRYMNSGEVQADFRSPKTGQVLFSYVANCNDRGNVDRFVQTRANSYPVHLIRSAFQSRQAQVNFVRLLIRQACTI